MPELPEVETVARQLAVSIAKRRIHSIETIDPKLKRSNLSRLAKFQVRSVIRMGKQVIISCRANSKTLFLAVHLRMTGRLVWCPKSKHLPEAEHKHIRVRLAMSGGELCFVDPRRFGTMQISALQDTFAPKGAEPLVPDFTAKKLSSLLRGSSQNIKVWLLRQDRIVGIGNIYASEILFDCGISPKRKANRIKESEIPMLHRSIQKILRRAIENNGTTFSDFQDAYGFTGSNQNYLKVYERGGKPCRRCRTQIVRKIVQGQRSTYYCESCQI